MLSSMVLKSEFRCFRSAERRLIVFADLFWTADHGHRDYASTTTTAAATTTPIVSSQRQAWSRQFFFPDKTRCCKGPRARTDGTQLSPQKLLNMLSKELFFFCVFLAVFAPAGWRHQSQLPACHLLSREEAREGLLREVGSGFRQLMVEVKRFWTEKKICSMYSGIAPKPKPKPGTLCGHRGLRPCPCERPNGVIFVRCAGAAAQSLMPPVKKSFSCCCCEATLRT